MLQQGLVGRTEGWDRQMRSRILSMLATLGAVAALALAGGASLGFVLGLVLRIGCRTGVQITILSLVYDVLVEHEIIGRLMWLALGY